MISVVPSEANNRRITPIRDTAATDRPLDLQPLKARRLYRRIAIGGGVLLSLLVAAVLVRSWLAAEMSVPLERVRIAAVGRGPFVRDVSAQGTVVAAVSPTLFAAAAGTVHYLVQAGDRVHRDQPIATLDSPTLRNELERERATLAGLEVAVQRQSIDTRRQLLANQQTIDLANLSIQAAQREQRRATDSWERRLISERDFEKARDDAATAAVNYEHSVQTAELQKESLQFELRAKRLERDRQRLVVSELQRRVADLEMKSPVDGIVGTLAANERGSLAQNAAVISVIDLSALEVEFQAPESYGDDLALGMAAQVSYAGRKHPAQVSAVSPEVKQGQVTGRLRFAEAIPPGLRQNQRLQARILLESRDDVLQVARGPFLDSGAGRVAYVVRNGVATRVAIETGSTSIAEVEILKGLTVGDQIIISNLSDFERAERVRLSK